MSAYSTLTQLAPPALAASQPEVVKTWDGRDQLIAVQDPRKLSTTYTLDGLGQKLNQTSPDTGTGTANSTFYADGRLKTQRDARGKLFSYTWDALGRPTQILHNTTTATATTFQYDNCTTNAGSVGQLCKLTDESGNTTYSHDGFGRVLSKTQTVTYTPTGGSLTSRSFVLGQTWGSTGGATGKLQSQTYPSKTRVNYLWATNGQLSGISINPVNTAGTATDTTKTVTLLNTLAYSGLGAVKGWAWGDGVAYARSFDGLGRLQTYPLGNPAGSGSAAGLTRTVGYDDAGRISSFTHSGTGANPSAFDQSFGYDGLDRLTANQQATSYGYGYDASGNRTSLKVAANTSLQRTSKKCCPEGCRALLVNRSVNWLPLSVSTLVIFIGAASWSRSKKSTLLASLWSAYTRRRHHQDFDRAEQPGYQRPGQTDRPPTNKQQPTATTTAVPESTSMPSRPAATGSILGVCCGNSS